MASAARPRLLRTLAAPVTPVGGASFTPQDITFSGDGRILASVTGTDQVSLWNVTDPARAARGTVSSAANERAQKHRAVVCCWLRG